MQQAEINAGEHASLKMVRQKKNECSSVKLAKRVRIKMLQRGMRQLCIHNVLRLGPPTAARHDKASLTAIPLGRLMIN